MTDPDSPNHPKPGRVTLPLWSDSTEGPKEGPRLDPAKLDPARLDPASRVAPRAEDAATMPPPLSDRPSIPLTAVTAEERMAVGSKPAPPGHASQNRPKTGQHLPKPGSITRHGHGPDAAPEAAPKPATQKPTQRPFTPAPAAQAQQAAQGDAPGRPRPGRVALPRWQADAEEEPRKSAAGAASDDAAAIPRSRRGRRFWRALFAFILALLVYDVVDRVTMIWEHSPYFGALFGFLLAMVFVTAIAAVMGEIRQLRKLRLAEVHHARFAELLIGGGQGKALPLTVRILPGLPTSEAAKERFAVTVHDTHSDRDVIELFNRTVMHPLDRQAYSIISRAARDSAIGVAVSPVAALDTVIALWRSLKMVREIAQVYGFRPGLPGTLLIARRILVGAALTATTDIIGNLWAEHLGGRVAGFLSAKLGEGVFTAIRVARLGLTTMEMCRPLPFLKEDEPSLNRLRKEIISGLL